MKTDDYWGKEIVILIETEHLMSSYYTLSLFSLENHN